MNMNKRIGNFIAILRKERKMTQEQLAQRLGVSNRSVSRWENGYTLPDISLMECICKEFNITLMELISGKKQISEKESRQYLEKNIYLVIEMLQNEKEKKSRVLNYYFGLGYIFLGIILIERLLLVLGIIENVFLNNIQVFVFVLVGLGFEILGFSYNNKIHKLSEKEVGIYIQNEKDIRMKSGDEMFQFAKKNQKYFLKQHKQSLEEICKKLSKEEYVMFSMFAEEYTIDDKPVAWHVGAAVSNERVFVCGETVSGRMFTRYVMDVFKRDEIDFIRLENKNIAIGTPRGKVILKGEKMEYLIQKMKKVLE